MGLGTALALWERGTFDPAWLADSMALPGLVQGWVTHGVNEIYDWRSGMNEDARAKALSGGSKIRNLALLVERDLWLVFAVASAGVVALAALDAMERAV